MRALLSDARFAPVVIGFALSIQSVTAAVKLPSLISDHMVLQRCDAAPIWGKADPGEEVIVRLADVEAKAQTDQNGDWRVTLPVSNLSAGPHSLVIQGTNRLEISDVLIGEVWMNAGQSNMAFALKSAIGGEQDARTASTSGVREFRVNGGASPTPRESCVGSWHLATPDQAGNFSAVGYYFARDLSRELKSPVGLIHASVGGTPVEAWTSRDAIATHPDLMASADVQWEEWQHTFPKAKSKYLSGLEDWQKRYDRVDKPTGKIEEFTTADTTGWPEATLPGKLSDSGLPNSGAVWLRKSIDFNFDSPSDSYRAVDLALPNGAYTVYWNGTKIGELTDTDSILSFTGAMRRHVIPSSLVRKGRNELAVRMFHPNGELGFSGDGGRFTFAYRDGNIEGRIPLAGKWKVKMERELPAISDAMRQELPPAPGKSPNGSLIASSLFNGLVNPVLPYKVRGVVWYQGENNVTRAYQYREAFPLLIRDWRAHQASEDLPFYFCQLPNYGQKSATPEESTWAELREAQALTQRLPHTGMAVLIDIGESRDVHPREKRIAGERLAAIVLADTYGKEIAHAGPVFQSMSIEGHQIRLRFQNADGGLVATPVPDTYVVKSLSQETAPLKRNSPQSQLEGFTICGADRKWHWADARIEDGTVVVTAPEVPSPTQVRYAWADNPTCNLRNGRGLPAAPFRTDDFPGKTINQKY